MKVKVKLDVQKLKRLAMEHAEKAVFAAIAIAALLMVFKSFGLPKFEKTQSDLQAATGRAQGALTTSEQEAVELVRTELKPKDFLPIASKNTQKFSPQGFSWHQVKPPAYDKGGKRQEPAYFVVEELRATPARGVFVSQGVSAALAVNDNNEAPDEGGDIQDAAPGGDKVKQPAVAGGAAAPESGGRRSMDPGGRRTMDPGGRRSMDPGGRRSMDPGGQQGGRPMGGPGRGPTVGSGSGEGLSYVVLLGKVPFGKQRKAYADALGGAEFRLDSDREPTYLSPSVERAEIVPGVADADLKWVAVTGSKALSTEIKSRLTPTGDPLLDPTHDLPPVTGTLYALAAGEWDPQTVNLEEFRAKSVAPQEVAAAVEPTTEQAADTPGGEDAPPELEGPPGAAATRPAGGPAGSGTMGSRPMGGKPMGRQPMGGRPMGGKPMGGKPMGGRPMQGGGGGAAVQTTEPTTAEYVLFRFFDFSVEPGKRYRYRVKLWLQNPNYEVQPQYLETGELAKRSYRGTELSPPTDPITVPNEGTVIAGLYNPPAGPTEGSAKVLAQQFLKAGGQTAVKEYDRVLRGQTANFEATDAMILEEGTGELLPWEQTVAFRNNAMLVDVAQAESKKPADVLILDAEGKLVVLSAETEQERFKELTRKLEKYKADKRRAELADDNKEKDKKSGKGSMTRRRDSDSGLLGGNQDKQQQ